MRISRRSLLCGVSAAVVARGASAEPNLVPIVLGSRGTAPALDINFTSGSIDPRITFTRASSGWYFDATGTLQSAATNTPRFDYDPASLQFRGVLFELPVTNTVANNTMVGAVAGTPGTVPTNWGASGSVNGITQQIVGTGVESGITYMDVRWFGTPTVTAFSWLQFDQFNGVSLNNQVWTSSLFCKLVGGSLTNLVDVEIRTEDHGGTGGGVGVTTFTPSTAPLATQRFSNTHTTTNTGTGLTVIGVIGVRFTSGSAIDVTLRIGLPQVEQTAFVTSPIVTTNAGTLTRAADGATMPAGAWYSSAASSLILDGTIVGNNTSLGHMVSIDDGTLTNRFTIRHISANIDTVVGKGTSGAYEAATPTMSGARFSYGTAVSANGSIQAYLTGVKVATAAGPAALPTTVTLLQIGKGNIYANSWIRRVRYWARALASFELAAYTGNTYDDTTLDLNFLNGTGTQNKALVFTRASTASYFDATGTLQSAATNTPRIDYDPSTLAVKGLLLEPSRTNSIRNPRAEGAVVGSPGTYPTNWSHSENTGITPQIVGSGVESGIPYVDFRIVGTVVGGTNNNIFFETSPVTASNSQAWAFSMYLRLVAGSFANVSTMSMLIGDNIGNLQQGIFFPSSGALAGGRIQTNTTTHATGVTNLTSLGIQLAPVVGQPVDVTIRIGLPQVEAGKFATSIVLPPTGTLAASTRAADTALVSAGSWYNATASSLCAEAQLEPNQAAGGFGNPMSIVRLCDNQGSPSNEQRFIVGANGDTSLGSGLKSAGVFSGIADNYTITEGAAFKIADSAVAGQYFSCANAGTVYSRANADVVMPTGVTLLTINVGGASLVQSSSWTRRVRYWPRALSSGELQQVTA